MWWAFFVRVGSRHLWGGTQGYVVWSRSEVLAPHAVVRGAESLPHRCPLEHY